MVSQKAMLDMMLIPDFGQVQSDDEILNLTSFETQYDEKRSFFTEGGDLFRAEIFYSRRIGTDPIFADEAENSLGVNEKVEAIPSETQIIKNTTESSGKSKNGTSLGFFECNDCVSLCNNKRHNRWK